MISARQLSAWLYRVLRKHGVQLRRPSVTLAHRKIRSGDKWRELKEVLLEALSAASARKDWLNHRDLDALLKRIELLERQASDHPLVNAIFNRTSDALENITPTFTTDGLRSGERFSASQLEAVQKANERPVLFIWGPAGSGKTGVLAEIVQGFVEGAERTLLCCHTKAALKIATDELGSSVRASTLFTARTVSAVIQDESIQAGYDNVLIDEASLVGLPHILCVCSLSLKRVIFVGDPMQLGPIVHESKADASWWLQRDIFLHQADSDNVSALFGWQDQHRSICVLLKETFGIPEKLFLVVNQLFYMSRLTNQAQSEVTISFIDTTKLNPKLSGRKRSPVNAVHAEIIAEEVGWLLEKKSIEDSGQSIGIITPFNQQRRYLEHLMGVRALPEAIEVGTVHTFQGRSKACLIFDLTVSDVDHLFQNLGGSARADGQAARMLNSALSRCRATAGGSDARLVVVANYQHVKNVYPGSVLVHFLERIRSRAGKLIEPERAPDPLSIGNYANKNISRFEQTTALLTEEVRKEHGNVLNTLRRSSEVDASPVRNLIVKYCEVLARQIQLCNASKLLNGADVFRETAGMQKRLEDLPIHASELATLASRSAFSPQSEAHFKSFVSDMYVLIYESTMLPSTRDTAKRPPPEPVFDKDALSGDSYGRIRIWLRELRNLYQHDTSDWQDYQKESIKTNTERLFQEAIAKPAPESSRDYLCVQLFVLQEVIWYLSEIRKRLGSSG